MGKKSLTKSTTKKKTTTKKKAAPNQTEVTAAPKKAAKKAAPKKKTPAPKKPTIKSLLKKDFGSWVPKKMYAVAPDKDYLKNFTAPPAVDETDKTKAKAIKALLAKKFDLNTPAKSDKPAKASKTTAEKPAVKKPAPAAEKEAKPAQPKAAPKPKKSVSIPELLKLKFESWQPKKMYSANPADEYQKGFSAPPAVDSADKATADRIRALLAKTFDLTVTEAVAAPAKEAPAAEPVIETAAKPPAKPVIEKTEEPKKAEEKPPAPATEKKHEAPKAEEKPAEPAPEPVAEAVKEPKKTETKAAPETSPAEPVKEALKAEAPEKPVAAPTGKAQPAPAPTPEKKVEPPKAEEKTVPPAPKPKETKPEIKKEVPKAPEKPPVPPAPPVAPVMPKVQEPTEPPKGNAVKMLIAIVGGLFGLLIIASAMNTNHYYLKSTGKAVEIWQGKFSPTGRKLIMTVPDATIKEPVKSVYTKKEAMVPAFDYYIRKAEALSEAKGLLDFETIKSNLYKAMDVAPTNAHKKEARNRLNKIDFMFLVYKADVAAGKNTIEGYKAALENLKKAAALSADKTQKELVDKKTKEIKQALETLEKSVKTPEPKAAVKKVAADAATQVKAAEEKTEAHAPVHH